MVASVHQLEHLKTSSLGLADDQESFYNFW